ncbi:MAG: hypothetical protein AABY01_01380 [Nanoarchaeota archaeon]
MDENNKKRIKETLEDIAKLRTLENEKAERILPVIQQDFLEYLANAINPELKNPIPKEDVKVDIFVDGDKFIVGVYHPCVGNEKAFINDKLRLYEKLNRGIDCGLKNEQNPATFRH